jgi:tetratricopeptide (TPR) repeat protein
MTGQENKSRTATQNVLNFHSSHQHETSGRPAKENHRHGGSHELALFLSDRNLDPDLALQQAIECYRTYPNVKTADALAWCHFRNGNYSTAQKLLTLALSQNTPLASLHYHAGLIFDALGEQSKAHEHLEEALALNPHFHPQQASNARELLASLTENPQSKTKTAKKSQ